MIGISNNWPHLGKDASTCRALIRGSSASDESFLNHLINIACWPGCIFVFFIFHGPKMLKMWENWLFTRRASTLTAYFRFYSQKPKKNHVKIHEDKYFPFILVSTACGLLDVEACRGISHSVIGPSSLLLALAAPSSAYFPSRGWGCCSVLHLCRFSLCSPPHLCWRWRKWRLCSWMRTCLDVFAQCPAAQGVPVLNLVLFLIFFCLTELPWLSGRPRSPVSP